MRTRSVAAYSAAAHAEGLFHSRLGKQIDLCLPLAQLAGRMPWADLEDALAPTLPPIQQAEAVRPAGEADGKVAVPQATYDLSDEEVCVRLSILAIVAGRSKASISCTGASRIG